MHEFDERRTVEAIIHEMAKQWGRCMDDPYGSVAIISAMFSEDGVFAGLDSEMVGPKNIRNGFLEYTTSGEEKDTAAIIRGFAWDPLTKTATVPWTWQATLLKERKFCDQILQPGTTYQQDDIVVFVFDKDYKIKYCHEHYNVNQSKSTLLYPPIHEVCQKRC